jgi:hypothetical protein
MDTHGPSNDAHGWWRREARARVWWGMRRGGVTSASTQALRWEFRLRSSDALVDGLDFWVNVSPPSDLLVDCIMMCHGDNEDVLSIKIVQAVLIQSTLLFVYRLWHNHVAHRDEIFYNLPHFSLNLYYLPHNQRVTWVLGPSRKTPRSPSFFHPYVQSLVLSPFSKYKIF